jgi:hypothetical protein
MAYDPVRNVTVVFGGQQVFSDVVLNDLWEWDGTEWTNRTPSPLPANWPARRDSATLVWDSTQSRLLLFGGEIPSMMIRGLPDLWSWDGTAWANLTPSDLSTWTPARSSQGAAWDEFLGVMIVFGGILSDHNIVGRDLWQWNPRTRAFQDLTPAMPPNLPATAWPLGVTSPAVAFDSLSDRLVIFGGNGRGNGSGVDVSRSLYVYGP